MSMRPLLRVSLTAFAASGLAVVAAVAQVASPPPPEMHRMQQWGSDHEALLDAKLGGLKAGLKLTPDQEKLWPPFEAAVRDAAKTPMEQMKAMMDRMQRMRGMNMTEQMQDTNDMKDMGPPGQSVSPVAFCAVAQT